MSIPLIFVTQLTPSGPLLLDESAEHHLRVRRQLNENQEVLFSDGLFYTKACLKLEKRKSWAIYESLTPCPTNKSGLHLHLCIIKPENLAWAVQKATEMGVDSIQLIWGERSQRSYWSAKSKEHLEKVILSACEQSGRYTPPTLFEPCPIQHLSFHQDYFWIYADIQKDGSAQNMLCKKGPICYLVGPEGGWSASEQSFLEQQAWCLSLDGAILRAETAALSITALLRWGPVFY